MSFQLEKYTIGLSCDCCGRKSKETFTFFHKGQDPFEQSDYCIKCLRALRDFLVAKVPDES